jgi:DNA polymerase
VAADDEKTLAAAARRYLAREADAGRGDLWTLAAAETPRPKKARPVAAVEPVPAPLEEVGVGLEDLEQPSVSPPGDTLDRIANEVVACTKCGLASTRTKAVPGIGSGRVGIVFVGEAPGAEEDRRGEPFVGRAGDLLTKMIQAMDEKQVIPGVQLSRDAVFIANVLKCRPPENRNPLPAEIEACSPYLVRQLALLRPRVIMCLGKFAAELLVGAKGTIGGMRGTVYRYGDAKLLVTYHPAACLRNPNYKRPVWEDLQLLAREYQSA